MGRGLVPVYHDQNLWYESATLDRDSNDIRHHLADLHRAHPPAVASTIRRRLAALSSLYKHLVRHDHAARNPVGGVERPAINRDEGSTLAFSKVQSRKMLDARPKIRRRPTRSGDPLRRLAGLGLRRAEIAALKVGDLHQNRGYDSLRVMRKGISSNHGI
jgi:integrase/recombinase XerD